MSSPENYYVCDGCGTWVRLPSEDKTRRLFLVLMFKEWHLANCPASSGPNGGLHRQEGESDFGNPDPARQWTETPLPALPPCEPEFRPDAMVTGDALAGSWSTDAYGSHSFKVLEWDAVGTGRFTYALIGGDDVSPFRWRLLDGGIVHLDFETDYPPLPIRCVVEPGDYFNERGQRSRYLRVFSEWDRRCLFESCR